MEQSPTCEAGQKIPHILWNMKVHYSVQKSPVLAPVLIHMNQISPHILIPCFFQFNLVFSSSVRISSQMLPS
jgi:hypothetical protein